MSKGFSREFPFEKLWTFQGIEHQIAMEFTYFNWYMAVQEPQRAFWIFAKILKKILAWEPAEGEDYIKIDTEKAEEFLQLYYGTDPESEDLMKRGLYALDLMHREVVEEFDKGRRSASHFTKYVVFCRGYGGEAGKSEDISPYSHHAVVMLYYQKLNPLLWKLWHQIADQIQLKGAGIPEAWLKETPLPSMNEIEAELPHMELSEKPRVDPYA